MGKGPRFLFALLAVTVMAACATNPVTGRRQMSLLSEAEELAIGQQQDAEIRREMGVYNDPSLQAYVSEIGQELARASHRPNLPWTFTIVDSPAINAFALPGGYIYITRGILAYLDDESELAGVLGHEIGHVTARHAAQAYTRQAQANLGLTILSIFVPSTRPFTDLGSVGLGVLFLKHGRDAELEADRLGVEYGSAAGWDPAGVPRFLSTLARVDALSDDGVPNWLATHPDPGSRVGEAEPVVGKFASPAATRRNRDDYLDRVNGLVYGDNREDGIVRGNVFLHPDLRLSVTFPEGWEVINSPEAVMAREPGTEHYMVLQEVEQPLLPRQGAGVQGGRSVGEIAVAAMRAAGYNVVDGRIEQINGHDAHVGLYRGTAEGTGKVMMRAAHIAMGRQMYVVAGFAPEGEFNLVDRDLSPAIQSFRELSAAEAARVQPNRVDFYTVRQGDSWQSIAVRQGKNIVNAATLAIMNDHEVNVQPQPGARVKIVVEG
ncbi:MAG: M48 family metalloprotease [Vicinamibacterales bacterium]